MKHQDMRPQQLVKRVRSGEMKTCSEWAREFGTTEKMISSVLVALRKKNYMLYPVGGGYKQAGIIREVTKRVKDYRDTNERLTKSQINPAVISGFRLRENYLLGDPSRRAEVEMTATEFVKFVEETRQRLLQSPNSHGNV